MIHLFSKLGFNLVIDIELNINNQIIRNVRSIEYNSHKNSPAKLTIVFANYTRNLAIKTGDKVIYKRGYKNGKMEKRFLGYISEVNQQSAVCFDELYYIRSQRCEIQEWRNTSDKKVLQSILGNISELRIDNGDLGLKFNKAEFEYPLINGNINKGTLINALFKDYIYYIDETDETFTVEKPYSRIKDNIKVSDLIMIEDNTIKPLSEIIKIRYIVQSDDKEDIIGEYPEGIESDRVYEMFFNGIALNQVLADVRYKYEELNNTKLIGSFILTGLPYIRMGEKIKVYDEYAKVVSVDETIDNRKIRQSITLE